MPSMSPTTSSRSRVSVRQINVEHDIVIEDFATKRQGYYDSLTDEEIEGDYLKEPTFIKGEFMAEIKPYEDKSRELLIGWGISHNNEVSCCGPAPWKMVFGLRNLSKDRHRLPITAKFHVMKDRKKMRTLESWEGILEPTERSEKKGLELQDVDEDEDEEEEEEEEDGYGWVDLFSSGELDDNDNSHPYEDEVKLKECLDKKGCLTIRVEISTVCPVDRRCNPR